MLPSFHVTLQLLYEYAQATTFVAIPPALITRLFLHSQIPSSRFQSLSEKKQIVAVDPDIKSSVFTASSRIEVMYVDLLRF